MKKALWQHWIGDSWSLSDGNCTAGAGFAKSGTSCSTTYGISGHRCPERWGCRQRLKESLLDMLPGRLPRSLHLRMPMILMF